MKTFTIIKTGYSAGQCGCSNKFFNVIFTNSKGLHSFRVKGMYGVESRIEHLMTKKGYKFHYVPTNYTQLKGEERRHAERWSLHETTAEDYIKGNFKNLNDLPN